MHNVAIMSDVAPDYAPVDQVLISVSTQGLDIPDEAALTEQIRQELTGWFGEGVLAWRHLRTYSIPHALPLYNPEQAGEDALQKPLQLTPNLYQCGDQTAYPSLNAAMQTGREVAELIGKNSGVVKSGSSY
ncbi:FAD-dependent oxidoreductase [Spirosoma telluris]|uniref:FAD-dependent oxidoreductase n=1 Tax=Spirosoma telluris TaxID=2183553 RepID=UPI002FC3CFA2